jgi:putative oxidoreductase
MTNNSGALASHGARADAGIDAASIGLLLTRFFLVCDFVLYGSQKFNNPQVIYKLLEAHHLPGVLVYPTFCLQLGGSLLLFLGLQTRLPALGLGIFCIIAPSVFWSDNLENLSRDCAAAGGFVLLFLFGPGRLSLDAAFERIGMRDMIVTAFPRFFANETLVARAVVLARALIAFPFLADVVKKLLYLGPESALFEAHHVPGVALYLVMLIELVGGLAVLFGYRIRTAAAVLLAWSLFLALVLHWPPFADTLAATYKIAGRGPFVSFMKDVTTWAALLILIAWPRKTPG